MSRYASLPLVFFARAFAAITANAELKEKTADVEKAVAEIFMSE
jgi:hypothetical protein